MCTALFISAQLIWQYTKDNNYSRSDLRWVRFIFYLTSWPHPRYFTLAEHICCIAVEESWTHREVPRRTDCLSDIRWWKNDQYGLLRTTGLTSFPRQCTERVLCTALNLQSRYNYSLLTPQDVSAGVVGVGGWDLEDNTRTSQKARMNGRKPTYSDAICNLMPDFWFPMSKGVRNSGGRGHSWLASQLPEVLSALVGLTVALFVCALSLFSSVFLHWLRGGNGLKRPSWEIYHISR